MNIVGDAISVLEDAKCFLNRIDNKDYSQPIELLSFSTIGQHTRHFIEFFQCLINQECSCQINYSKRQRDLRIESDSEFAKNTIDWIIKHLGQLDLDKEVKLYTESDLSGQDFIKSNIAREVVYNIEHVIHHLALLKVGLKIQCPELKLSDHFGVAPSTIKHRKALHKAV